jgi:hypothetical protein
MTGSITIGRAPALRSPREIRATGGGPSTITAQASGTTDAAYQALCFTLAGYPNPDEPFVPIITTGRLVGLTGLYVIESVEISRTVGDGEHAWKATVTVTGTRVPSYAAPLAQLSHFGHLRSNALSFSSASESYGLALPTAAQEVSGLPTSGTWATIDGDGGDVKLWYKQTAGFDADVLYGLPPANWYDAAATIEAKLGGGSTWYDVPGQHIENLPTSVRIGNTLARLSLSTAGGYLILNTEHFDGTQWETAKDWRIIETASGFGAVTSAFAVSVLYNTPACCIVRFALTTTGGPTTGRAMLDVKVRRGIRNIECTIKTDVVTTWTVERATAETGAAIPGGIAAGVRANANDAAGNRYLLITPDDYTADTVQGGIDFNGAAVAFRFCLSSEIGGSGASAPDDYVTLRRLYFGGVSELPVEVVAR